MGYDKSQDQVVNCAETTAATPLLTEKAKLTDVFNDYCHHRKINNERIVEWVNMVSRDINNEPSTRDDIYNNILKHINEGRALGVNQFILTIYRRDRILNSFLKVKEYDLPYNFDVMAEYMPDEKRFYSSIYLKGELDKALLNIEYEADKQELHLCMYLRKNNHCCHDLEQDACVCEIL